MSAFLIIGFREGLEAFLVLGIVLAFLQMRNLLNIKKYAWAGFGVGVVLSIFLGIFFTVFVDGFESEEWQYDITLVVLFSAIVLLTYMVFWIQHNSEADTMRKKIEISPNQKLVTFLIVFSAILREGLETVLFFLALVMGGDTKFFEGVIGLGLGFAVSALIVWILFKRSVKLPLKSFFKYSSYFLVFIVAGLVSLFIKGLQGNEYIPIYLAQLYDSSFLMTNDSVVGKIFGVLVGYDAQPTLIQFLAWLTYLMTLFFIIKRRESRCKK